MMAAIIFSPTVMGLLKYSLPKRGQHIFWRKKGTDLLLFIYSNVFCYFLKRDAFTINLDWRGKLRGKGEKRVVGEMKGKGRRDGTK